MSLYRNILKQALIVSWKHKYLWFFGLFAALFIDNSGFEFLLQAFQSGAGSLAESLRSIGSTGIFSLNGLSNAGSVFASEPLLATLSVLLLLLLLALFLFLFWLAVVSQLAIVNNSAKAFANKKAVFQDGIAVGAKNFWPALILNFIAFFIILIPVAIASFNPEQWILKLVYFLFFFAVIILVIAFSFMIKFAIANLVIKGTDLSASLKKGWELFSKNWLISIEMALILFAVALFGFLSIRFFLIPFMLILVWYLAAVLFSLLSFSASVAAAVFLFFLIVGYVTAFLVVVAFGAFLATFQISAWTKLYMELSGKGAESKIVRMIEGFRNR